VSLRLRARDYVYGDGAREGDAAGRMALTEVTHARRTGVALNPAV